MADIFKIHDFLVSIHYYFAKKSAKFDIFLYQIQLFASNCVEFSENYEISYRQTEISAKSIKKLLRVTISPSYHPQLWIMIFQLFALISKIA